jgi:hypothetical protein
MLKLKPWDAYSKGILPDNPEQECITQKNE